MMTDTYFLLFIHMRKKAGANINSKETFNLKKNSGWASFQNEKTKYFVAPRHDPNLKQHVHFSIFWTDATIH